MPSKCNTQNHDGYGKGLADDATAIRLWGIANCYSDWVGLLAYYNIAMTDELKAWVKAKEIGFN